VILVQWYLLRKKCNYKIGQINININKTNKCNLCFYATMNMNRANRYYNICIDHFIIGIGSIIIQKEKK